ncbi:MAG: ATP-binding protein [Betaproteobacteria bacterium]
MPVTLVEPAAGALEAFVPAGSDALGPGPAALQSALALCASSPLPMMLWWEGHAQPYANTASSAFADLSTAAAAAPLWQALLTDVQTVMRTGQALQRSGAAQMLPHSDLQEDPLGAYCLNPLQEQGRTAGVLLIGTHSDPRPSSTWRERMNYAAVIHSMDLGFALVELLEEDAQGLLDYRYLEVNPAYEVESGLSNLVGRRITEVVQTRQPFWSEAFKQVAATGSMLQTTVKLGSNARTIETCIMRMGGPSSRRMAVLIKDLSARQRDEVRLQLSEHRARDAARKAQAERNRLAAVLEATPAAVVVVDARHQVTLFNSQARRSWGDLSAPNRSPWTGRWADGGERDGQALTPQDWPMHRALRGQSVREVIEIESPLDARKSAIYLSSAAPIWGPEAKIEGAVVVAVDITERVMAERALKHASERKDEFLAMLAHELRNPLAPIAVAAELMGRSDTTAQALSESRAIISRQVRHMSGLIDDLLDAARVSRGTIRLERCPLDLRYLVHQAMEQSAALLETMGHAVELDLPAQGLTIYGDGKRVVQILANVLNNAAKYTPAGGRIRIQARPHKGSAEIEISDNGIGMDASTLERAFELFAQADRGADRQQGGLGIGLALVKKLVMLHGGQVQADSVGPGQGSRIRIRLPLSDAAPAVASSQADGGSPKEQRALSIMVVDDNADAANTLVLLLEAWGHRCTVAHSAEQALALAMARPPQVFILDIGLPGMDGKELARLLRREAVTAGARLLALSGYAQAHEQEAARQAGFDHYLVKPVDVQQLLHLLQAEAGARGSGSG